MNIRADAPDAGERVAAVIGAGVPVASFALAPKPELIAALKDAGVVTIASVGARRHAEKVAAWGVDAVIATGGEGGGHTGAVPTSLLIPQVADAVDIPVIAAGGFFDGRGLVAALAYGAAGIAMGTRFLLTTDSPVADAVKRVYLAAGLDGTVVTRRVDGVPHRVLRTPLVDRLERGGRIGALLRSARNAVRFREVSGLSSVELLRSGRELRRGGELSWAQVLMAANTPMLLRAAMVDGRPDLGLMSSGQVAGLIEDLPSCAELIDRVMAEAEARLAALRRLTAAAPCVPVRALDDRHVGLAAALAHRQQAALPPVRSSACSSVVSSLAPVAPRGWPRAIAPPLGLTRGEVRAGLPLPGEDDRGERLVDLDQVDLVEREPGPAQRVRGRRDRRGEHQHRVVAAGGQMRDPGARFQAALADRTLGRDQQGGRAVRDLAGQGGGDPAVLPQRDGVWPSSRRWCRGAGTHPRSGRRRARSRLRSGRGRSRRPPWRDCRGRTAPSRPG